MNVRPHLLASLTKKKPLAIVVLVLFATTFLLILLPSARSPVYAQTTVGTSTVNTATEFGYQNPMDYANGFYWVTAYSGSSNEVCSSATIGGTYVCYTYSTSGAKGSTGVGYAYSGTNIYRFIVGPSNNCAEYYDSGTLNADGTVTWGTENHFTVSSSYCVSGKGNFLSLHHS